MKAEEVKTKSNSTVDINKDGESIYITMMLESGKMLEATLSLKDAIIIDDRLCDIIKELQDEVFNIQIVPMELKILIDCGKVNRLEYTLADQRTATEEDEEDDTALYRIKAIFNKKTEKSKTYYIKTKFFEDEKLRKRQLDYIDNIPVIFKDSTPPEAESLGSMRGYNLNSLSDDFKSGEFAAVIRSGITQPQA